MSRSHFIHPPLPTSAFCVWLLLLFAAISSAADMLSRDFGWDSINIITGLPGAGNGTIVRSLSGQTGPMVNHTKTM